MRRSVSVRCRGGGALWVQVFNSPALKRAKSAVVKAKRFKRREKQFVRRQRRLVQVCACLW